MSKIALQGNGSGTGKITIASPNTNSDRILTLPDTDGNFWTSGNDGPDSGLDAATISDVGVGTVGKILYGVSDIDNLHKSGFYTTYNVQTNTPWTGENTYLIHIEQGTIYATQIAFRFTGGAECGIKTRQRTNSVPTWGGWIEYAKVASSKTVSVNNNTLTSVLDFNGLWDKAFLIRIGLATQNDLYATTALIVTAAASGQIMRFNQIGADPQNASINYSGNIVQYKQTSGVTQNVYVRYQEVI